MRIERAPNEKELQALRNIYLKAETDIINEIGRLRSLGYIDYHSVAALERVQEILLKMQTDADKYIPQMIEKQFYVRVPEAARILEEVEKHAAGYKNAQVLTATQTDVVQKLINQLTGQIAEAAATVQTTLDNMLIGRTEPDVFRRVGLETVAEAETLGRRNINQMVETLKRDGITAFTDRAGRNWRLHTYADMVTRTTSRQAEVLAVLTADPEHDLYKISSHGTTCPICAPYEGRVYSRSGKSKDFPPLAAAFGKIDPAGPDDLTNTYLNIHPNCLHVLMPWTPMGRSDEEIEEAKQFSSFKENPPDVDPRSEAQREAYRKKEDNRSEWLRNYRQWEDYRVVLGEDVPKRWETFVKHKKADDDVYKEWQRLYREANKDLLKSANGLNDPGESAIINLYKGSGVDFGDSNIPYRVKREVRKAIKRVDNDFPFLTQCSEPAVIEDVIDGMAANVYDPATGKNLLKLDKTTFSDKAAAIKKLKQDYSSGQSYKTENLGSLVAHEKGHNAHVALALRKSGLPYGVPLTPEQLYLFNREYDAIKQEIYLAAFTDESLEEIYDKCKKELGSMATKPEELIAQSFGNYYYGVHKSEIAKSIVKYFSKGLHGHV